MYQCPGKAQCEYQSYESPPCTRKRALPRHTLHLPLIQAPNVPGQHLNLTAPGSAPTVITFRSSFATMPPQFPQMDWPPRWNAAQIPPHLIMQSPPNLQAQQRPGTEPHEVFQRLKWSVLEPLSEIQIFGPNDQGVLQWNAFSTNAANPSVRLPLRIPRNPAWRFALSRCKAGGTGTTLDWSICGPRKGG